MAMNSRAESVQALKKSLVAGYPIIGIDSLEEDQVENALTALFRSAFPTEGPAFYLWDLQNGFTGKGPLAGEAITDLLQALDKIYQSAEQGFFICKDVFRFIEKPEVQRRLQNIAQKFRGQHRFLFLLGREIILPVDLRKEIHLEYYGFPDLVEIQEAVEKNLAHAQKKGIEVQLDADQIHHLAITLQGFTTTEIQHILNKSLYGQKVLDANLLVTLQNEKEQLTRKEGVLEYFRTPFGIEDVGGLSNLKNWLLKRKALFSAKAVDAGIAPPKGLLMMGISGCGKSLAVKAISSLWGLPLFRLDMNTVYSGMYGSPEGTFHRAIRTIETVAPAILWIDEIEGGISSSTMKDGSTGSHIFSAFLTWMQEKSSQIFVAATANRIDLLPAEIIRKGRFDQVFFVDLPNDKEREEIFRVHLLRNNLPADEFDYAFLSVATDSWNGAEIEHVVKAAMVDAFYRGAPMTQDDLYNIIRNTVPLARTMSEQIKFIKGWASERAISASATEKSG
jgi:hypothetical protein